MVLIQVLSSFLFEFVAWLLTDVFPVSPFRAVQFGFASLERANERVEMHRGGYAAHSG